MKRPVTGLGAATPRFEIAFGMECFEETRLHFQSARARFGFVLHRRFDRLDAFLEFLVVELAELVAQFEFLLIELDRFVIGFEAFDEPAQTRILFARGLLERRGLLFEIACSRF